MTPLTADLVSRVVLQEATAAGTTPTRVLCMAPDSLSVAARRRAFRRLARETGANAGALARIWGCDVSAVARFLRVEDTRPAPDIQDRNLRPAGDTVSTAGALSIFAAIDRMRGLA